MRACIVATVVLFGLACAAGGAAVVRTPLTPQAIHQRPVRTLNMRSPQVQLLVLHSFRGGNDGALPGAALTAGAHGVFFGTTQSGGAKNMGTVYELTPSGSRYKESVLHGFSGGARDGALPAAALIKDASGTLYGTTVEGGFKAKRGCTFVQYRGCGTVFKLTRSGKSYTESLVYAFQGPANGDGFWPYAGLAADSAGALYGTTMWGGSFDFGGVFKLTPSRKHYAEAVIYSFPYSSSGPGFAPDGYNPTADILVDNSGSLYGTTPYGGSCPGALIGGCGAAFKLTPAGSGYAFTLLYRFQGGNDGNQPLGALVADNSGALYGTTEYGGPANDGTVFKLTPSESGYTESIVYAFAGGSDGALPVAGLNWYGGALYGTTSSGGAANLGTIFKLTPSSSGFTESVLYAFQGGNDGADPVAGLISGPTGILYGTTQTGGASGVGTVFALSQ